MAGDDVGKAFAAVYWTYPVPWAGFTELPRGAVEAARRSRTIRYQRELVSRHVRREGGALVDEFVFLETSPDHATDAFDEVMPAIVGLCGSGRVTLCYVDFSVQMGWRKHERLRRAIERHGLRDEPVPATRLEIEGERFDPRTHFRTWRAVDEAFRQGQGLRAETALAAALDAVPPGYGRNVAIAGRLNAEGILSHSGRAWTPDNVRMAVRKLEAAVEED